MTMQHPAELAFTQELTLQTEHYAKAFAVAERIQAGIQAEQDISHDLMEMGQLMASVGEFRSRAIQAQDAWKATGRQAGRELTEAFENHQATLGQLLNAVRTNEEMAAAAKDKLEPQLQTVARDRKVVQRYGDAAKL